MQRHIYIAVLSLGKIVDSTALILHHDFCSIDEAEIVLEVVVEEGSSSCGHLCSHSILREDR
ncbi:hypothetical protein Taro_024535 [Colocasia esculenta]|uniref:Uncharacterized protein n=1 Tax=Colocasia esculenta TaxID=4460 RepID=A0A843VDY1_COLES|nr:hypothetical protein [Colocasia esculenta]